MSKNRKKKHRHSSPIPLTLDIMSTQIRKLRERTYMSNVAYNRRRHKCIVISKLNFFILRVQNLLLEVAKFKCKKFFLLGWVQLL